MVDPQLASTPSRLPPPISIPDPQTVPDPCSSSPPPVSAPALPSPTPRRRSTFSASTDSITLSQRRKSNPRLFAAHPLEHKFSQPLLKRSDNNSAKWFNFSQRPTAKEAQEAVTGFLRDILKRPDLSSSASLILEGCSEACRSYGLSLSSVLQEPSIGGHSPIYWAVVARPPGPYDPTIPDLIDTFIAYATPLSSTGLSEIRLACVHNSDQVLYQRLRDITVISPMSHTEELLLGGRHARDKITVQDSPDDGLAFIARMRVVQFQKRLRVSNEVHLEFIAGGRIWSLKLLVASADGTRTRPKAKVKKGRLVVILSLLEHSPPTYIDSRLIIESLERPLPPLPNEANSARRKSHRKADSAETKSSNCVRLNSGASQLTPDKQSSFLTATFKDATLADRLQYHGRPYITTDGSLHMRLEARLRKPDSECIIC
ncbi:hypothetical protein WOLCODRAFT_107625 [Wolfiporia cocos MD-104 SS10]|uniref:Uncharacterized protein n=1 Tax=Wolfiporia cocos (strain MD-104) TaxID=742152 RepID=A0A2H3J0D4_WOLCO|nr:hypothetical protein WOLCODRAFT_107625 [Wolfiporia cocos MD-104 SS10]